MPTSALTDRAKVRPKRGLFSRFSFQSKLARSGHYRPEIDGLRALAVLPVLFYHVDIPGFSGGFVGVDMFYVISGYLITSIIAKDVFLNRFSFISFYERRIRRIFPALFGVVFFSILAGAVLLAPKEFATFGKGLVAMTFFLSNIFFKRIGGVEGYFGGDAHSQVLLHTWSLSVEEQFYLFFPTVLVLVTLVARKRVRECLWAGLVLSFVINVWATQHAPRAAFYVLIPRAWELLLGALLALKAVPLLQNRVARELAGIAGLVLIGWAIVGFTPATPFPGYAALLPCLGSGLIIYSGEGGPSLVRSILSFQPLVFIGVISYSLYLYHWPIIVFSKYVAVGGLSVSATVFAIALSLVMAFVSYEFIESPFRGGDSLFSRRQIFSIGIVTSAASAALGLAIYTTHGFPVRFSESTRQLITENTERKGDYQEVCTNWKKPINSMADMTFCTVGEQSSKKILFWGDSHVQQLYPLVQKIYDEGGLPDRGAIFAIAAGCSLTEHMNRATPGFHCDSFAHYAMLRAEEDDIDTIYIGFAAPRMVDLCPAVDGRCIGKMSDEEVRVRVLQEVSDHVQQLKARGKRVIVSLPFPLYSKSIPELEVRNAVLQRFGSVETATEVSLPSARSALATLATNLGAEVFDPRKSLCSESGCVTELNGVSIYKDHSHIAASQIGILRENMEATLREAAGSPSDRVQSSLHPQARPHLQ